MKIRQKSTNVNSIRIKMRSGLFFPKNVKISPHLVALPSINEITSIAKNPMRAH
jgi:hypothetical protein